MFQIRDDHQQAFQDAAVDNFTERGVTHLRAALPAATAEFTDHQLKQRIRESIGRAGEYGLTSEQQVMTFVDATYLAGEHFDTDPGNEMARDLLQNPYVAPDKKAVYLLGVIQYDDRKLIPRNPGPGGRS